MEVNERIGLICTRLTYEERVIRVATVQNIFRSEGEVVPSSKIIAAGIKAWERFHLPEIIRDRAAAKDRDPELVVLLREAVDKIYLKVTENVNREFVKKLAISTHDLASQLRVCQDNLLNIERSLTEQLVEKEAAASKRITDLELLLKEERHRVAILSKSVVFEYSTRSSKRESDNDPNEALVCALDSAKSELAEKAKHNLELIKDLEQTRLLLKRAVASQDRAQQKYFMLNAKVFDSIKQAVRNDSSGTIEER